MLVRASRHSRSDPRNGTIGGQDGQRRDARQHSQNANRQLGNHRQPASPDLELMARPSAIGSRTDVTAIAPPRLLSTSAISTCSLGPSVLPQSCARARSALPFAGLFCDRLLPCCPAWAAADTPEATTLRVRSKQLDPDCRRPKRNPSANAVRSVYACAASREGGPPGTKRVAIAAHRAVQIPAFFSGTDRMRLPVATKIALSTAGAATAMVGSPMPPQKPPEGIRTTSTSGISAMRIRL